MYRPNTPYSADELEAARHLLWHYGQPGGWEPGSFATQLIRTLEAADTFNRARLLAAFPAYARPVQALEIHGSSALAEFINP